MCFAGLAICACSPAGNVAVRVDGCLASIASVIAMSGDARLSCRQAQIMIHRPSVYAAGTVDDWKKPRLLMKIEEGITPIYASERG